MNVVLSKHYCGGHIKADERRRAYGMWHVWGLKYTDKSTDLRLTPVVRCCEHSHGTCKSTMRGIYLTGVTDVYSLPRNNSVPCSQLNNVAGWHCPAVYSFLYRNLPVQLIIQL